MDNDQRKQLINDVKALQRLNRSLEKSLLRIGKSNDTTSFRSTLNSDILKGNNLKQSLLSTVNRVRSQSIDAQADKLLSDADPIIEKFNSISLSINNKLQQHEPIKDSYNAYVMMMETLMVEGEVAMMQVIIHHSNNYTNNNNNHNHHHNKK
eukprot:331053_1